MAGAPLERTRWPGIYRRGKRYADEWTGADDCRHRATADSLDDAKRLTAEKEEDARSGVLPAGPTKGLTVAAYALELSGCDTTRADTQKPVRGRSQGRRGEGRPRTLDTYRRDLENHGLLPGGRHTPRDLRPAARAVRRGR